MEDGQRRFTVDVEFPTSNRDALPWSGQLVLHLDVAAGMLAVEGVCLDGGTGKISFVEQEAALCFPLSSTVFSLTGEEGDESVVISGMCDAGIQVEFAVLVPAFARGDDLVQLLESGGATAVQERASGNGRKEEMRPAPINVSTPEHNYTRPASREALKSASVAGWPVSTKSNYGSIMSSAGIKTRTARAGCSPFNESEREWPGEGEEGEEIIREMEELVRLLHRRGVEGQAALQKMAARGAGEDQMCAVEHEVAEIAQELEAAQRCLASCLASCHEPSPHPSCPPHQQHLPHSALSHAPRGFAGGGGGGGGGGSAWGEGA
ncbi:hypothetical protein T484DRAFT_1771501, partial [Baffinella frigidus]